MDDKQLLKLAAKDKYGDRTCPLCGCHTNASAMACCDEIVEVQRRAAAAIATQEGGE